MSDVELIGCEDLTPRDRRVCSAIVRSYGSKKGLLLDPRVARIRKMKSTVTTGARLIQDRLGRGLCLSETNWRSAMITLTYAQVDGWEASHIRDYLTHVRNWLSRRGVPFRYVWVAELQDRGAVHYHIVVWLPRLGRGRWNFMKLPKPDEVGWWPHGSSNVKWAKKSVGYLVKYASKMDDLPSDVRFPKGLRLYGVGGTLEKERVELRFWRAPLYAREALGSSADIRKVKGGYECRFSGDFVASPWSFFGFVDGRPFFVYTGFITED